MDDRAFTIYIGDVTWLKWIENFFDPLFHVRIIMNKDQYDKGMQTGIIQKESYELCNIELYYAHSKINLCKFSNVLILPSHFNYPDDYMQFMHNSFLGPSSQTTKFAYDKIAQLDWFDQHHFKKIESIIAQDLKDIEMFAQEHIYPIVIKKKTGTFGTGNQIILSASDLDIKIDYPVIVERFVSGEEWSVNVMVNRGFIRILPPIYKGCTDNSLIHPANRVRYSASNYRTNIKKEMQKVTLDVFSKLSFSGFAELEFIVENDTVYILELNPRISASLKMSLLISNANITDIFFLKNNSIDTYYKNYVIEFRLNQIDANEHLQISNICDACFVTSRVTLYADTIKKLIKNIEEIYPSNIFEQMINKRFI